jgi:hypothetical protein
MKSGDALKGSSLSQAQFERLQAQGGEISLPPREKEEREGDDAFLEGLEGLPKVADLFPESSSQSSQHKKTKVPSV